MVVEIATSMALCTSTTTSFGPTPRCATSCPVLDVDLNPRMTTTHQPVSKCVVSGLSALLANSKHCSSSCTGDAFDLASVSMPFVRGSCPDLHDGVENGVEFRIAPPRYKKTRELSPVSVLQGPSSYNTTGCSGKRSRIISVVEQQVGSNVEVSSLSIDQRQALLLREEFLNRTSTTAEDLCSHTDSLQLSEVLPLSVAMDLQQMGENILLDAQKRQEIFKDLFVIKAFQEAEKAHHGQFRASGDIYLVHCVETAIILAEIGASKVVVAAGLLHDVIDDSCDNYDSDKIEEMFGEQVTHLVEGVSKLSEFSKLARDNDIASKKLEADRLHTMFLAMADVHVVLIKLADRLHNMRTLDALPEEKRLRMAKETLEIFTALANRLGIWSWKAELEDLCFKHLKPYEHAKLATKLVGGLRESVIVESICKIERTLYEEGVLYHDLSGRSKSFYGIYMKMMKKGMNLEDIYDVQGLRVIVNNEEDCYRALETVHRLWPQLSANIKDYILHPKENGYQSLHTVVQGDDGFPLEVQIRTKEMHYQAEFGIAAHWRYKENNVEISSSILQMVEWARWTLTWQSEILETKSRLPLGSLSSKLICGFPYHKEGCPHIDFMQSPPKKEDGPLFVIILDNDKMMVQELPAGSTVGDLLYWKVDDSFVATGGVAFCEELLPKVNHKVVDVGHKLKTGDLVEVKPLISDDALLEYRNRIKRMFGDAVTWETRQPMRLSP